jgi:hypothetical protein
MTTCGIYGFEFTRPFQAAGLEFRPLYKNRDEAHRLALDNCAHHLTGTVSGADLLEDQATFRIEAVLSFIEHLDVRLSEPSDVATATTEPLSLFEPVLHIGRRDHSGGAILNPDTFPPHRYARRDFIDQALGRLADEAFCKDSKFGLLFFKAAESFRQRRPTLEVKYFLLFSGLEAFARKAQNDFGSNAAKPIAQTLKAHGFDVYQDNEKSRPRAIATYRDIRNAIFHNGELARIVPLGRKRKTALQSEDYLYHLQMLVCLTVMKVIGFEDLQRNWDCWFDLKPHGNLGQGDWSDFLVANAEVSKP